MDDVSSVREYCTVLLSERGWFKLVSDSEFWSNDCKCEQTKQENCYYASKNIPWKDLGLEYCTHRCGKNAAREVQVHRHNHGDGHGHRHGHSHGHGHDVTVNVHNCHDQCALADTLSIVRGSSGTISLSSENKHEQTVKCTVLYCNNLNMARDICFAARNVLVNGKDMPCLHHVSLLLSRVLRIYSCSVLYTKHCLYSHSHDTHW